MFASATTRRFLVRHDGAASSRFLVATVAHVIPKSRSQHGRDLVKGGALALALRVLGSVLQLSFGVVLGRRLGAEGAGVYFLAVTVVTVLGTLSRLGLDGAALRYISAAAALGRWTETSAIARTALTLGLTAGVAVGAALFVLADWMAESVFRLAEGAAVLRLLSVAVPGVVVLVIYGEALKAVRAVGRSQLLQGALLPGGALLSAVLLIPYLGVLGAGWGYLIGLGLAIGGGGLMWRGVLSANGPVDPSGAFPLGSLLSTSMPLMWVASMDLLVAWSATLLLGAFGTPSQVGIFSVSLRLAGIVSFVLMAVNAVAAPKFGELFSKGDLIGLKETVFSAVRLTGLAGAVPLLALLLAPKELLGVFGPDFVQGKWVLIFLAAGQMVNVATGSVGYLLMMTGRETLMKRNAIIAGVVNVALCGTLIPCYGAVGAAVATSASVACLNLGAALLVYRELDIVTFAAWFGHSAPEAGDMEELG